MSVNNDKVTAATHWVWTAKAERHNGTRSVEGQAIWPHYLHEAPRKWLDEGLIQDSTEYVDPGQVDLFELI
ncbi:hypothetical protein [Paenibacillus polymyxa]|uniref:hypothetical protein n=1 Tax=Paenibacillus polymyxa TaxID=1406 RepID=UPI0025B6C883|nr:hypothetical protein [Paenibacillus polymyxa]MDN4085948.1 hypothetical protein [Paenibacillus polymyxa]MDN4111850.1 hypothetical protein [Paenibacillus polymyxa]